MYVYVCVCKFTGCLKNSLQAKGFPSLNKNPIQSNPNCMQGRGKTTLLSVLRDRGSTLPDNISTVGVVVNKWECNLQTRGRRVRMMLWEIP